MRTRTLSPLLSLFVCFTFSHLVLSPLSAQVCTSSIALRSASCPGGTGVTCTTKGSTLTSAEGDNAFLNIVKLCNVVKTDGITGSMIAPSTIPDGDLISNYSGVGGCSAGSLVSAVNDNAAPTCTTDDDVPDSDAEILDAHTLAGGTLSGTNTVTGILNLDSGTEGHLLLPSSTTLPATCTLGDTYWDTDADADGSLYVCRATNVWKEVDDDGGSGGGALSRVSLRRITTPQSIPSAVWTAVSFNQEDADQGGWHDNVTNPTRAEVPTGVSGPVMVTAGILIQRGLGMRGVQIRINGTTVVCENVDPGQANTSLNLGLSCARGLEVVDTDYIEVLVFQEHGSNLDLAADYRTFLTVTQNR